MDTKHKWTPYYFLALPSLMLLIFVYVPIFQNIGLSFYQWNPFMEGKNYIGFQNFINLFKDPIFYTALKNNILYVIISVVFQVGGGLIVAAILEDTVIRKLSPVFRTIYFIPAVISTIVIAILFDFIYNPQIGLLNEFLNLVGLDQLTKAWLGDSTTAIFAVIAVSQWKSIGYIAIFFIIAIQNIPNELYEAAELDGAGRINKFIHITVPRVKEITFVTTAVTVCEAFTVFNEPYMLTGGGPGDSSQVLSTYIYKAAFTNNEMGYAATISTILLIITLIFSIVQLWLFRSGKEE